MKITVNGAVTEVSTATLSKVLEELGYGGAKIATALNEKFVPIGARQGVSVSPGDRLEIVAPRQGG